MLTIYLGLPDFPSFPKERRKHEFSREVGSLDYKLVPPTAIKT